MTKKMDMAPANETYEVWCVSECEGCKYLHYGVTLARDEENAKERMVNTVKLITIGHQVSDPCFELSEAVGPNFLDEHGITIEELRELANTYVVDHVKYYPLQIEPWAPELRYRPWIKEE